MILEVNIKHETMKHPQSLALVEKMHAALKPILEPKTNSDWSDWSLYVNLAKFIHNISFYSSINCTPSQIFLGRIPVKPIGIQFGTNKQTREKLTYDCLIGLHDNMINTYKKSKTSIIKAYHGYRSYYDRKDKAKSLQLHSHCLPLNPILTTQNDLAAKAHQLWLPF